MKAAVFHGTRDIKYETVPDPVIEHPRDAIIRVTMTAICGSDLHIYNGLFPQPRNMVLGHEFMGIVEEVGPEVLSLNPGDRVIVPFPISCGECFFCMRGEVVHCENSNPKHYGAEGGLLDGKGAGLFGYTDLYGGHEGGQAERVRVPFADFGPRKVPDDLTDEQVIFLTDILPTGWTGVDWAELQGGETVAVFGCGPVGLMAQKSAWIKGARRVIGIDILRYRCDMAIKVAQSEVINAAETEPIEAIRNMTQGRGADVCIDAVGMEAGRGIMEKLSAAIHVERGTIKVLEDCFSAVRRGGKVIILGVYGTMYDNFPLHQMFDKGLTVRGGQAPVQRYVDHLMELVRTGKIQADDIITHRLKLSDVSLGYDIFTKKKENCVKIVMTP